MLTMIVYYHCKDGKRDEFISALNNANMAGRCQSESGNFQYDYFIPQDDSNVLLLIEKWDNEECQLQHTRTDNFKELSSIKALFVEKVEIERFIS